MKKIYQNPEITVVVMQTTLLSASIEMVGGNAEGPGMSRDFDDWDE